MLYPLKAQTFRYLHFPTFTFAIWVPLFSLIKGNGNMWMWNVITELEGSAQHMAPPGDSHNPLRVRVYSKSLGVRHVCLPAAWNDAIGLGYSSLLFSSANFLNANGFELIFCLFLCFSTFSLLWVRSTAESNYFSSSLCVQSSSDALPASCPMDTRDPFRGVKRGRSVTLISHPCVVPRPRMKRSYALSSS
jgi:hypothetical protein